MAATNLQPLDSGEKWKAILGFEGRYEVSDLGRVRSLDRYVNHVAGARIAPGAILALSPRRDGYSYVTLYKNNKGRKVLVHRLVAGAFLPPPEAGRDCVNHINGVKTDNRAPNLEWATVAENNAHAGRMGLMQRGVLRHNAKLHPGSVREIRALARKGLSYSQIAKRYDVSNRTVGNIIRRISWRHVE